VVAKDQNPSKPPTKLVYMTGTQGMVYILLVLLPVPPLVITFYQSYVNLSQRGFDLGVVFSWIVFVYSWVPLFGIVLARSGYGTIHDSRFVINAPTNSEIFEVASCYMSFLIGFVALYLCIRRLGVKSYLLIRPGGNDTALVFIGFTFILSVSGLLTSSLGASEALDYAGSYTKYRHLPLLAQQIVGVLSQLKFTMLIAVMVYAIMRKPSNHKYVAILVACVLIETVLSGGSRAFGFLLAFAYLVCYSICVQHVKGRVVFMLFATGLVLFSIAGVLRTGGFEPELSIIGFFQKGESVAVFNNALDVLLRTKESSQALLDWNRYFGDLARLVPQQFLWFDKLDMANWYVSTYFPGYHKSGGGLAFGSIAESLIGYGVVEALIRGAILGVGFAVVTNFCLTGRVGALKMVVYVWFVVISFQAVRDTTFTVFARFFLHVFPVILILLSTRQISLAVSDGKAQKSGRDLSKDFG